MNQLFRVKALLLLFLSIILFTLTNCQKSIKNTEYPHIITLDNYTYQMITKIERYLNKTEQREIFVLLAKPFCF